jgi:hypothetical protein
MGEPTPRQQAGYLRRLLRRGVLVVIDPHSGSPAAVSVELEDDCVRLLPSLAPGTAPEDPEERRWAELLDRLRRRIGLREAEELVCAVEAEWAAQPVQSQPARSYIPQST